MKFKKQHHILRIININQFFVLIITTLLSTTYNNFSCYQGWWGQRWPRRNVLYCAMIITTIKMDMLLDLAHSINFTETNTDFEYVILSHKNLVDKKLYLLLILFIEPKVCLVIYMLHYLWDYSMIYRVNIVLFILYFSCYAFIKWKDIDGNNINNSQLSNSLALWVDTMFKEGHGFNWWLR